VQLLLVVHELLPADVPSVTVFDTGLPLLDGKSRNPSSVQLPIYERFPLLSPAKDICSCVDRIMEHSKNQRVMRRGGIDFTGARVSYRDRELMSSKVPHHSVCTPVNPKALEHQFHHLLNVLVRIQAKAACALIPLVSCGRHEEELSAACLALLASLQAQAHPILLGFAHRAFEPEQELVVVVTGVIDSLFVPDEYIRQTAQVQQSVPVCGGPSEPRYFKRKDGTDSPVRHLLREMLKTSSPFCTHTAFSEIIINDFDAFGFPPEVRRSLLQRVLASCRLAVRMHLLHRRLP